MRQSSYKHIAIGSRAVGDVVVKIKKPTDESAYSKLWSGQTRFENPKWYEIHLKDGRVYKDTQLIPVITPEGDISLEVVQ